MDFGQVDPALGAAMVPVARFYEACDPLILRTIQATEAAMAAALGTREDEASGLGVVYLVGGAGELPVLARALRERFGDRFLRLADPEIDKDLVKSELTSEQLGDCGLRLDQDERFFAEPARLPAAEGM